DGEPAGLHLRELRRGRSAARELAGPAVEIRLDVPSLSRAEVVDDALGVLLVPGRGGQTILRLAHGGLRRLIPPFLRVGPGQVSGSGGLFRHRRLARRSALAWLFQ